ncbi:MAG: type II toxin-antitoxin system HipA family toxin [Propionibacteriaceae bacterium]
MSAGSLVVVLYGQQVGTLAPAPNGGVSFAYAPQYLSRRIKPPLSVRMPVQSKTLTPARVVPFLDGLLPENREVRRQKARDLDIGDDLFSLLAVMGWDCPGAVQITSPERFEDMLSRVGDLEPVTEAEIGLRIARLRDHSAAWTLPEEHWSLAGQQEKFALVRLRSADGTGGGWAEALGSAATTHIVKPGIGRLHSQALVEHVTMRAAGALGLDVARSDYVEFDGQPAIVVERFDRVQLSDGTVQRIHQEDFCQATGRMPESKYEVHGGPTAKDMARVLRAHAHDPAPELRRLADFVLINWAAAAPDGHSKNVSIRILPNGDVRMAPFYDLASGLPYDNATVDRRLALAIGGERNIDRIHAAQWTRAARELGVEEEWLHQRARSLMAGFPDAFRDALVAMGTPEASLLWKQSSTRIAEHTASCLARLET